MILIAGLIVLGFVLIAMEIFIPGGIVGAVGGLCLIIGAVVAYQEYGGKGALIATGVGLLGVVASLFFEFKILPKTAVGKRLFLVKSVAGKSQRDVADDSVIGKDGSALTALSPSGYVLIDGRKYEATSRSGYVARGESVKVVSYDTFKVTVSKN